MWCILIHVSLLSLLGKEGDSGGCNPSSHVHMYDRCCHLNSVLAVTKEFVTVDSIWNRGN